MENEELALREEMTGMQEEAYRINISSDLDYVMCADFTKKVKATEKKVKEYWEPLRKSSYEAYNSVLAKIKEMVAPLTDTEKILKSKMVAYEEMKEQERIKAEAEARRLALEEMKKREDEARKMEEEGDVFGAAEALEEIENMKTAAEMMNTKTSDVKVEGVSKRTSWEITEIDSEKVPTEVAGVCIRPVDKSAVLALIKSSKGQIKIPGVTYKETTVMAIKS